MMPAGFGPAFERVVGAGAVDALIRAFSTHPIILIAGDQLTGKTTLATRVASALGGLAMSTGAVVRARARELGLSIEDMSRLLRAAPDEDVRNDYAAALAIARGDAVVFESRLAGHLGSWLRGLGREGIVSVYVGCPPRERLLRWVDRTVGKLAREAIDRRLSTPVDADFEACVGALSALGVPGADAVAPVLAKVATRDRDDRARLADLYGFDYADATIFDARIDTSMASPEHNATEVTGLARKHRS